MPERYDHRYDSGRVWLKAMRTPGPRPVPKSGSVLLSGKPASASAAKLPTA